MRLKQIKIINFGQLSDLTFDLPSNELNVFFGQNEAGKSTTVAFIKQVMFGFYLRTNSSPFFEDYKPLAHVSPMGGSLVFEDSDGSQFKLERLWAKGDKTKKGILTVTKNGEQVPESLFFDKIQNIDGSFYTDSFIFNQDMLGQVAKMSQADLLERIYYLGAANSSQLLDLREGFSKEADKLFKKTGKRPQVNQLLSELTEERQNLTDIQQQFETYDQLNKEVNDKERELKIEQDKLKQIQNKIQELQKLQENLTNFAQLKKLQAQQKEIKFDLENYETARDLTAQIKNLQKNIASLQAKLSSQQPTEIFDVEAAKKLVRQRPELLQWEAQYKACLQKARQLQAEAEQIIKLNPNIKEIGSLTGEEVAAMRADYQQLPTQTIENIEVKNTKPLLYGGVIVAIVGLISMTFSLATGIVLVVLGLAAAGYAYYQNNQTKQAIQQQSRQKQQKEAVYQNFENKYHIDPTQIDINNLISEYNLYQSKKNAIEANNVDLESIKQKVGQLSSNLEKLLNKRFGYDFEALKDELDQLDDQLENKRHSEEEQLHLQNTLYEDKQQERDLTLQLKALMAKDDVDSLTDYNQLYRESLDQAKLHTQIKALKESLGLSLTDLEKIDPERLKIEIDKNHKQIQDEQDQINEIRQFLAQKQVEQNNLADSTAVFEAKQKLANTETEFLKASQDYLSDLLASKWIGRALDIASNERFPKMLATAKEYFKLLTNGRYVDLELNKKITVTRADGKKREVKYLSRGTAEQLYFALKLAFVHQIRDQINLPILIDDSFVNFDDSRTTDIKQLLEKISEDNQVLIFTAQVALVEKLGVKAITFEKGNQNA